MSAWVSGPGDQPARDVLAVRMTPVPGPSGVNPVAEMLAQEVAAALERLDQNRAQSGSAGVPGLVSEGLPMLTATAVGALEGTLKSKSLDGALKEAQILAAYGEARERNANAEKLEAEAELARIAVARARLELALEKCRAFGVDPALALVTGGTAGLVLGEGLAAQVADGSPARQITAGAEAQTEDVGEGEQ